MRFNAIILAGLIVAAAGTLTSYSTSKQVTVNAGPGASKFITVHKSNASPTAPSDGGPGIVERLSGWISGKDSAQQVQIVTLSSDSAPVVEKGE
ncbi:hypothetical protein [Aestuariivita boseongensis]|uniref:hypothetical protein n=1 Tax=Aestuariivita boseongensis TaxID=1470562 RepID=UPI0006829537|nr:hypothetical protein [Aestuariivita boseongensis]